MIGIGTDIIEIERIERALERHGDRFLRRVLVPEELEECRKASAPARYLAKRFAAKEAISKALGTGIGIALSWQDLSIERQPSGQPRVMLSPQGRSVLKGLGGSTILLSLSDERAYAVAFAVVLA